MDTEEECKEMGEEEEVMEEEDGGEEEEYEYEEVEGEDERQLVFNVYHSADKSEATKYKEDKNDTASDKESLNEYVHLTKKVLKDTTLDRKSANEYVCHSADKGESCKGDENKNDSASVKKSLNEYVYNNEDKLYNPCQLKLLGTLIAIAVLY